MKLTDLNPKWVGAGGSGVSNADGSPVEAREGVGVSFDCPCGGQCSSEAWQSRVFVTLSNPLDGKPYDSHGAPRWERTGETFETLTLAPSIRRLDEKGCQWHGYVTNGEIIHCSDFLQRPTGDKPCQT